jgi:AraC-like DNA-binding protein
MLSGVRARSTQDHARCAALAGEVGIPFGQSSDPAARVNAQQYVALCRAMIAELDDEALGFLSRPLRPGSLAMIARSALGARDVEAALKRVARSLSLLQDDLLCECWREGRLFGIGFTHRAGDLQILRFGHEYLLRALWQLAVWLHAERLKARTFDFSFTLTEEMARDQQDYERIFPAPQRFGMNRTAVWFDAGEMERPLRRGADELEAFLRATPDNIIVSGLVPTGTAARIQTMLRLAAPAWPDLPEVAHQLGMSISSLQRHLAHEHTSFRQVKDGLRRDMALFALRTRDVPLAVLADELGFADNAAFQRAFKSWTGIAPGRFRQHSRKGAG